jgi:glucose-1-phosphate thymidylyltransferase
MVRRAPSDVTVIAQRSRANEDTPDRIAIGVFGQAVLSNVAAAWPPHCRLDISTLADRVATDGGKLRLHRTDAWWSYDGDPLDLLELNRIALGRLRASNRGRAHDENRIEGPVLVDECASVSDSVIVGPAAIGARARINHAYIGPYTSVGAGARIEGAEVERSIIASGASITHVRGRIVASVVGQNARVFHDFSLPRALRLRVGAGTEVALY